MSEADEWLDEHGPLPTATIRTEFSDRTGWPITERGLYRTLKRLAASDLLSVEAVPVARTGRPRKDDAMTDLGRDYVARFAATTRSVDPSKG